MLSAIYIDNNIRPTSYFQRQLLDNNLVVNITIQDENQTFLGSLGSEGIISSVIPRLAFHFLSDSSLWRRSAQLFAFDLLCIESSIFTHCLLLSDLVSWSGCGCEISIIIRSRHCREEVGAKAAGQRNAPNLNSGASNLICGRSHGTPLICTRISHRALS